jgi:hypothetical protein
VLATLIAELGCVDAGEKVFAGAEEDRGNGEMHLVDESRAQVLPDCSDAPAQPDILAIRGFAGAFQRNVDAVTKWKVVPPFMGTDARGWLVSTNTGV